MALTLDTFGSLVSSSLSNWTITGYSRYDPTIITAVTPSGKSASITAIRQGAGALVTVTVNANTRTTTLPSWETDFEPGDKSLQQILATWQKLPANQR